MTSTKIVKFIIPDHPKIIELNNSNRSISVAERAIPLPSSQSTQSYFECKSDLEIWRMFKQGHEGAFRYIYEKYLALLFRFGYKFTNDREQIKDCIQDLFVVLRQADDLSDTDCIKFYLLSGFKWKLLRMLKKQNSVNKNIVMEDFYLETFEVSEETRLIREQMDMEIKIKLKKAINNLTRQERSVIYYFYTQGFNYEQIRSIMDLQSVKSARNLLYKSLGALRALLKV